MAKITHHIEISLKSIIATIAILLGIYFLYQVSDILFFLFISILLMAALSPLVNKLESWKLKRGLSIGIAYLALILTLALFVGIIVPPFISQIGTMVTQIPIPPNLANDLKHINLSLQDIQVIANQLTSLPKVLGFVGDAFSGVIVFISLLVVSFYLLQERSGLSKSLMLLYRGDKEKAARAEKFITNVEAEIGGWVRAELLLMFFVGLLTFVGLTALQVKYALSLAIIAGLLEILPNIGPTLSAIPAIAVAYFTISPVMAIMVTILYVLIQQIENNLIVPYVMRQAVGLSPVVTITLLLVGFRLAGVAGAALAIPLFLVGKVVVVEIYKLRDQIE